MHCERCGNVIDKNQNTCKHCTSRKKTRWIFIPLILLLLLIYPLLQITISVHMPVEETVNESFIIIREVTSEIPVEQTICERVPYRYSTLGGNVASLGNNLQPNLFLQNLEEEWGLYIINFSFVDEEKFSYEEYGGQNLLTKLENNEISIDDADFHSINYEYYLGPGETMTFVEKIRKQENNKQYWAMANIREPTKIVCSKVYEYDYVTENKSFTQSKNVIKTVKEKRNVTIGAYLGIHSFWEWFVIIFMFFIILALVFRIKHKRKMSKLNNSNQNSNN